METEAQGGLVMGRRSHSSGAAQRRCEPFPEPLLLSPVRAACPGLPWPCCLLLAWGPLLALIRFVQLFCFVVYQDPGALLCCFSSLGGVRCAPSICLYQPQAQLPVWAD